jgi:hypothetical protein
MANRDNLLGQRGRQFEQNLAVLQENYFRLDRSRLDKKSSAPLDRSINAILRAAKKHAG